MPELMPLQELFQHYLLKGDEKISRNIAGNNPGFIKERLGIYGDSYHLRLIAALASNFPALEALAGEELFEQFAKEYIAIYPPVKYTARYYGDKLNQYLAKTKPYSERPELAEIAMISWAHGETMDAADDPILQVSEMSAIPPEAWPNMHLSVHPSVQTLDLITNSPEIWAAVNQNHPLPEITISQEPITWVMWRKDLNSFYRPLTTIESWVLEALKCDQSFSDICEGLCDFLPEEKVAEYAATTIVRFLQEGLLSSVRIDDN